MYIHVYMYMCVYTRVCIYVSPAFYKRYNAFHAMVDINVTFPRSSHPFKKSGNNPYALFTTCLPQKLLIHT